MSQAKNKPSPSEISAPTEPILTRVSDVEPQKVEWLWPDRFPLGKFSVLAGDPGLGKSLLTIFMAAQVTSGRCWPDIEGPPAPKGSVILLSAEDAIADTIRPRLEAAGADVEKVEVIEMVRMLDERTGQPTKAPFSLERDLPGLEQALRQRDDCRLLVIDPFTAYLGRTDAHKNAELRSLLAPLADLAARTNVAVVAVTHLNKSKGSSAGYRLIGSIASVAAARVAWVVTKHPNNPQRRLMLSVKSNISREAKGLAFSVVPSEANPDTATIHWEEELVELDADSVLAAEIEGTEIGGRLQEAVDWLTTYLEDGARPANEVKPDAEKDSITARTLDRAKERLGIKPRRLGFGGQGIWVWELPQSHSAPTSPIDRQAPDVATNGAVGDLCDQSSTTDTESDPPQSKTEAK